MRRLPSRLFSVLNEYFFDVEEGEPVDVGSAVAFYGSCGIGIVGSVLIAVAYVL